MPMLSGSMERRRAIPCTRRVDSATRREQPLYILRVPRPGELDQVVFENLEDAACENVPAGVSFGASSCTKRKKCAK